MLREKIDLWGTLHISECGSDIFFPSANLCSCPWRNERNHCKAAPWIPMATWWWVNRFSWMCWTPLSALIETVAPTHLDLAVYGDGLLFICFIYFSSFLYYLSRGPTIIELCTNLHGGKVEWKYITHPIIAKMDCQECRLHVEQIWNSISDQFIPVIIVRFIML